MKDYKIESGSAAFNETIQITETTDGNHADNINAAPKQVYENTVANRREIDALKKSTMPSSHNSDPEAHPTLAARARGLELALNGSVTMSGETVPTTETEGKKGQHYINTETGEEFVCTAAEDGTYTWEKIDYDSETQKPLRGVLEEAKSTAEAAAKATADAQTVDATTAAALKAATGTTPNTPSEALEALAKKMNALPQSIAAGTYAGTGTESATIKLSFTPKYVLSFCSNGYGYLEPSVTRNIYYRAAAAGNNPCVYSGFTALEIVTNGFKVGTKSFSRPDNNNVSVSVQLNTSKLTYHYFAIR